MTSTLTYVVKRNGELQAFDPTRIEQAIYKAFVETGEAGMVEAGKVSSAVVTYLQKESTTASTDGQYVPSVEFVQDMVESELMRQGYLTTAKAYILYREKQAQARKKDIFKKRVHLRPYEYPELLEYVDAVRHSYWIHTEFNFTRDVQDYRINTDEVERSAIKNTMLAIAQIEVAVKMFWGDIYKKMPKPEIGSVGMTFAESEVRHQDAYAHLLEILNLNDEFAKIKEIPVLMDRVEYLEKSLRNAKSEDNKDYAQSILLFSLFIEHVSLFSQFLIIMSFNKYKNLFKGMSNAVEATSKEEQIHGMFGIDIIKIIKKENPTWFDAEYERDIEKACREAFDAESKVIDWIFEKGELPFLSKDVIKEFIKNRFNNSLKSIGMGAIFTIDEELLLETEWFDDEIIGTKHVDFFDKRSINYNKRAQSVTGDDLF
ncbi:ribonucleotide-diphosphate reductase subunit beta [Candidatus Nomurabacteria bacterium]|nr:ribonucleotide-diphosphate reductase subunit beta [Candidatus Nomurabacteria bacterium]